MTMIWLSVLGRRTDSSEQMQLYLLSFARGISDSRLHQLKRCRTNLQKTHNINNKQED